MVSKFVALLGRTQLPVALGAHPLTPSRRGHANENRVGSRDVMTATAKASIEGPSAVTIPTSVVLGLGHSFEVSRVDAPRMATKMVDVMASRNGSNEPAVSRTVRALAGEHSVTGARDAALFPGSAPHPAAIDAHFHFGKEHRERAPIVHHNYRIAGTVTVWHMSSRAPLLANDLHRRMEIGERVRMRAAARLGFQRPIKIAFGDRTVAARGDQNAALLASALPLPVSRKRGAADVGAGFSRTHPRTLKGERGSGGDGGKR